MAGVRTVAVLDIGRTNVKVAVYDLETGDECELVTASNTVRPDGPYPHFDVDQLWTFFCQALADLGRRHAVDAISISAHGASAALLSGTDTGDGLALPVLDYEHDGPDSVADAYDAIRPSFRETYSPRLPRGLNLGAQLFWQERRFPAAFADAAAIVTYPQYWAWRLTGVSATDATSLGCHTDLWNPPKATLSSLCRTTRWDAKLAPVRPAVEPLGPIHSDLARHLGLSPTIPVLCGIHDSNASLLPHLLSRAAPFTVVSTGTWVVVFCVGGGLDRLDERRDTLANVDAFGKPVPCARFMGGREFEVLGGASMAEPDAAAVASVIDARVMALPSFVSGVGPYPDRAGSWTVAPDSLPDAIRQAAASLYLALVTAECTGLADGSGPIIVEGPFAANALFCSALSALNGTPVQAAPTTTGTGFGAALMARRGEKIVPPPTRPAAPLDHPDFHAYAEAWRRAASAGLSNATGTSVSASAD